MAIRYDGSLQRQGSLKPVQQGREFDWVLQRHLADRAGLHYDLRLGDPDTGLLSWAVPKARLPEKPGESVLAIRQTVHRYSYGKFEGTIDKGRGKGTVELADTGRLAVTEATPNHIRFALLHPRNPKEYTLMRKGGDTWFLINTTAGHSLSEAYPKQHYKVTKDPESMLQPGVTASPKIDGAAVLMEFMRNRADVSSIRPSAAGGPIKHTWRIGGLDRIRVPKPLQGSVLRGEVYGKRGAKVIPIQELGAYLNMATLKSREAQRREGVRLHVGLYGLARPGTGQTAPKSRQELRKLFDLAMTATGGVAHPLPEADDPTSARKLLELVKSGNHPLTREGVVFFKEGQKPTKYVTSQENDVYIREIFPADAATGRPRAGGFAYSLTKDGPVVGRVGSGFSRADSEDMLQNPEQWLGRTARVSAKDQFESGAYRTPVFLARHEG